jgi:hypothetical protein
VAASVPADEIFAHIELILGEANPDGLDSALEGVLDELIARAFENDKKGTVQALLAMEHLGNRDYLFDELVDSNEEWCRENFESLFGDALGRSDHTSF